MKEIPLTKGKVALVDDEDFEWLNQWKWYCHSNNYACRRVTKNGKSWISYMHKEILDSPGNTDHINGNGLDNRRSNLRSCTQQQNMRNQRPVRKRASKFKGVYNTGKGKRKPWRAAIGDCGYKHIGYFWTQEEAAVAYNKEATRRFGEFANLNEVVI